MKKVTLAQIWKQLLEILNRFKKSIKIHLKSYDRSVMWNAWGYVYFSEEKYLKAMKAYNLY